MVVLLQNLLVSKTVQHNGHLIWGNVGNLLHCILPSVLSCVIAHNILVIYLWSLHSHCFGFGWANVPCHISISVKLVLWKVLSRVCGLYLHCSCAAVTSHYFWMQKFAQWTLLVFDCMCLGVSLRDLNKPVWYGNILKYENFIWKIVLIYKCWLFQSSVQLRFGKITLSDAVPSQMTFMLNCILIHSVSQCDMLMQDCWSYGQLNVMVGLHISLNDSNHCFVSSNYSMWRRYRHNILVALAVVCKLWACYI